MNHPSTPTPHLVAWCLSAWLLGGFSTHAATDTLTASAAQPAPSAGVSATGPHLGVDDLIRQVLRHNPDIRPAQPQTPSAQAVPYTHPTLPPNTQVYTRVLQCTSNNKTNTIKTHIGQ